MRSSQDLPVMPLVAVTLAGLLAIGWGAMFLIAPVWQPGYAAVAYTMPAAAEADEGPWPININTADAKELMLLDGIGEAKAAAILQYRQQYGRFANVGELENVPGISARMVESWAGQITVDDGP